MHIANWKKAFWKVHILYDSNYTPFCQRHNYGDSADIGVCQREEWINRWNTRNLGDGETILGDTVMADIDYKVVKTHRLYNKKNET